MHLQLAVALSTVVALVRSLRSGPILNMRPHPEILACPSALIDCGRMGWRQGRGALVLQLNSNALLYGGTPHSPCLHLTISSCSQSSAFAIAEEFQHHRHAVRELGCSQYATFNTSWSFQWAMRKLCEARKAPGASISWDIAD